jgi:hypothetical protein
MTVVAGIAGAAGIARALAQLRLALIEFSRLVPH